MPERSGRPRLRTSHQAERVRVTPALTGGGSVAPTPGTPAFRVQAPDTLVARAPDAARPQHVALPHHSAPQRRRAVVRLPRELRVLPAPAKVEPTRARAGDCPPGGASREAEAEMKRLEAVGELG